MKIMKKREIHWGGIFFIIGIALAIIIALFSWLSNSVANAYWPYLTLACLGIFVGIMNVAEHEKERFMLASVVFLITIDIVSNTISTILGGWQAILTFADLLISFFGPAAAMIALISLFSIAKK